MREASGRPRGRPARVSGRRRRTSAPCASVQDFPRSTPSPDPPGQRLDQRERRSAPHGVARRRVGHAPTVSGHAPRQAGRDPPKPAGPRAARTSPRARSRRNRRQPGAPLANQHDANHSAQRETGLARRPRPALRAQTRGHPGAAVRRPRPGRPAPRWQAAGLTAAGCVVHDRSLHGTRPEYHRRRPPQSGGCTSAPLGQRDRRLDFDQQPCDRESADARDCLRRMVG